MASWKHDILRTHYERKCSSISSEIPAKKQARRKIRTHSYAEAQRAHRTIQYQASTGKSVMRSTHFSTWVFFSFLWLLLFCLDTSHGAAQLLVSSFVSVSTWSLVSESGLPFRSCPLILYFVTGSTTLDAPYPIYQQQGGFKYDILFFWFYKVSRWKETSVPGKHTLFYLRNDRHNVFYLSDFPIWFPNSIWFFWFNQVYPHGQKRTAPCHIRNVCTLFP